MYILYLVPRTNTGICILVHVRDKYRAISYRRVNESRIQFNGWSTVPRMSARSLKSFTFVSFNSHQSLMYTFVSHYLLRA